MIVRGAQSEGGGGTQKILILNQKSSFNGIYIDFMRLFYLRLSFIIFPYTFSPRFYFVSFEWTIFTPVQYIYKLHDFYVLKLFLILEQKISVSFRRCLVPISSQHKATEIKASPDVSYIFFRFLYPFCIRRFACISQCLKMSHFAWK